MILRDARAHPRQFHHLMAGGGSIRANQWPATPSAVPGSHRHDAVHLLLRQHHALMPFVPGLPAGRALRRGPARVDHCRGIRGGRPRGVLRVLPQAPFQLGDPRLQRHDPCLLLGDELQQLLDDTPRLLQRLRAQVLRQRRHTTTYRALSSHSYHIFYRSTSPRPERLLRRYSPRSP